MLNILISEVEIIENFKEYLKGEDIDENNIFFEDVNDYLMLMYFDFFDNIDTVEEREAVEEHIENIIYSNFNINTEV